MFAHIVLFRPKPDISDSDRQTMFEALRVASTEIPSVRRFHIGKRVTHGRTYESLMVEDYPYSAVIEFDDLAGLKAYLTHRQHERLGELFYAMLEKGLVYDYEMTQP
jgi:hypothetical protein